MAQGQRRVCIPSCVYQHVGAGAGVWCTGTQYSLGLAYWVLGASTACHGKECWNGGCRGEWAWRLETSLPAAAYAMWVGRACCRCGLRPFGQHTSIADTCLARCLCHGCLDAAEAPDSLTKESACAAGRPARYVTCWQCQLLGAPSAESLFRPIGLREPYGQLMFYCHQLGASIAWFFDHTVCL